MMIDPASATPLSVYKLMVGLIVPRPIAFVSTVSAAGDGNLAPFSFFTAISANPPVICFSPMVGSSGRAIKDTLRNVRETREFVVNIVSEEIAAQMNVCSAEFPPGVNEFDRSGLTQTPSQLVAPPRVKESKAQMECKLLEIVEVSTKPLGGSLVIGEVVRFHIADELFDDFRIDADKLNAIGRMSGAAYTRTRDRFDLQRP